ncbi:MULTISPECIES: nitroreductase family protein [Arsenicicoccus]|uniref:nitroreductase family protein n=1 Tax=Arsenicicoccus TaxID=267408 RepID=UPI00257D3E26|nr:MULTISPECIES: nitroreductase family protein [Arsenicicoccus]
MTPPPHDLVLPVLRQRWSPRDFDPAHVLGEDEVEALVDAARWAPSAGNSQPWAFHLAVRDSPEHADLVPLLAGSSRPWAAAAGLLVVNLCHTHVEETDWDYSEFAAYDLGQAVAHMTIQAHSLGLACRQFAAFDREAVTSLLAVPPHWQVMTMTAIGRAAPHARRTSGSDQRRRARWTGGAGGRHTD